MDESHHLGNLFKIHNTYEESGQIKNSLT